MNNNNFRLELAGIMDFFTQSQQYQKWIKNIRGYYDREKWSSIQLANWTEFISQFVHPVGEEGMR